MFAYNLLIAACFVVMSAFVDSADVFRARLEALGLGGLQPAFELKGWHTYRKFAFASTKAPGTYNDEEFNILIASQVTEDERLTPDLLCLHLEAYTLAVDEIKQRAAKPEAGSGSAVKGLAEAERKARLTEIRTRLLPGLPIKGELEPSVWITDKYVDQAEHQSIMWIDWDAIGRRDDEVRGVQKRRTWEADINGQVKVVEREEPTAAIYRNELQFLKLMQRRGVALNLARMLPFERHEELVREYMALLEEPPMPGHERVTYA